MIIEIIIKSWSGTLEQAHMEGLLNNPEVADAMFEEHNQYAAAQVVFKVSTCPPPVNATKKEAIQMAKFIASGGREGSPPRV